MALREQVARADVEEEAAKDGEDDAKLDLRKSEEVGRCDAHDGRDGVDCEPPQCAEAAAAVSEHDGNRVDAV